MNEEIVSHIIKLIGAIEGGKLIQALKSCGINDDIQVSRKGINFPFKSLRQLSDFNVHIDEVRRYLRKKYDYGRRTYPVKLCHKKGRVFINLRKIDYDFATYGSVPLPFRALPFYGGVLCLVILIYLHFIFS